MGCSHFLDIMGASVMIHLQVFVCTYILNSSRYILLGHVATLYLAFSGTVELFHSSCTILDFHEQYVRVSIFLGHCQYLLLSIFFIRAHFVGVKWYLIVVLVYIFLDTTDVSICLCAYWPHIILNIYSNVQILCRFFKLRCLFIVEFQEFFIYFAH